MKSIESALDGLGKGRDCAKGENDLWKGQCLRFYIFMNETVTKGWTIYDYERDCAKGLNNLWKKLWQRVERSIWKGLCQRIERSMKGTVTKGWTIYMKGTVPKAWMIYKTEFVWALKDLWKELCQGLNYLWKILCQRFDRAMKETVSETLKSL